MKVEIFKSIDWYEWLYEVSNLWRVKSLNYNNSWDSKVLKNNSTWRYVQVMLYRNLKSRRFLVHRLVAQAFIPNPEKKPQINHKDWNGFNNVIENLEWNTESENQCHSYRELWRKPTTNAKWKFWEENPSSKDVIQYDTNLKEIKKWWSIKDVQRELWIIAGSISNCCNWKKWAKTAGGFIWKFKTN